MRYDVMCFARSSHFDRSQEKLCSKADASLFAFGSHSKKRPSNLLLGRLFDGHLLDMFELGVERFVSMHELHVRSNGLILI